MAREERKAEIRADKEAAMAISATRRIARRVVSAGKRAAKASQRTLRREPTLSTKSLRATSSREATES